MPLGNRLERSFLINPIGYSVTSPQDHKGAAEKTGNRKRQMHSTVKRAWPDQTEPDHIQWGHSGLIFSSEWILELLGLWLHAASFGDCSSCQAERSIHLFSYCVLVEHWYDLQKCFQPRLANIWVFIIQRIQNDWKKLLTVNLSRYDISLEDLQEGGTSGQLHILLGDRQKLLE